MKFTYLFSLVAAVLTMAPSALAFPAFDRLSSQEVNEMAKRWMQDKRQLQIPTVGRKQIPDADHPFQAPSSTAQRGPCPGLNIMANHGYINREGITDFNELVYGQQEAMGWAADLSIFLAAIAVALDGNPLNGKVSIGGPDSRVGTIPLLQSGDRIPGGILKHNTYEIDSSLTRDDVYLGDNRVLNGTLYQQIWEVADKMNNGNVNADVMSVVRSNRYEASLQDNPRFTFAPIGVLFLGADHFLWSTMVSSDETGEPGVSNRETLSGFYGARSTGPTTWEYVPEQFPTEWYRRARPLTIPEVLTDALLTITSAIAKGQLPTGINSKNVQSPEAFTCAIKQVVLGQIPAAILGIDLVGSFLTNLGNIASNC